MGSANIRFDQLNSCCSGVILLTKLTMHRIGNQQAPQEEAPVEDTGTVSQIEYQMMKNALEGMKRTKKAEIEGKEVIGRAITPQTLNTFCLSIILSKFFATSKFCCAGTCTDTQKTSTGRNQKKISEH